ncbi:uncharacterized protein LOC133311517 [Gastrolobium bilobum]|uniref:uncharacterized protein LOC133311517 n=1 Tax=Gastrolobium bilobum TaxID=150636 RepID=UPI002AB014B7|nr:uncharacterized protein LOC133311517 [Gastrolobium bilobum]
MRCKKHIPDLSSTVGVCATCLRERLIALIAAQTQAQAQLTRVISRASDECSINSDSNPPPPLIFPRSVSPYVSRRKSDYAAAWHGSSDSRDRLFYSTPQLGPTFYGGDCAANSACNARPFKKRLSKFWNFSNLFRSRSEKFQSDPSCEQSSSSSSPSWFSTFFPDRRKNRDRVKMTEDSTVRAPRRHRQTDRGMSPVRTEDFADECDQSQYGSGYLSELSPWWRRTPSATAPSARRSRLGHKKSVSGSGMGFCLSPLVRASPNCRLNHKGFPPEMAAAVEIRAAAKPHLSAAASFCANRSRKLADFGRVNQNR